MRLAKLVLALIAVALAALPTAAQDNGAAEAAIRQSVAAYTAAFEKGDVDGLLADWAADADYINSSGVAYKGRDKVAELFKQHLAELKGYKMHMDIKSLRFIGDNAAVEDGELHLTSPNDEKRSSRYVAVWSKNGDKWQIQSVRDLPNEPESEPTAANERLKQLEWMVGDWSHKGEAAEATIHCHWALNQNFLVHEYTVKMKDADPFEVTQYIGWDPENEQLRSWYFDSRGSFGEGLWTREGNTWRIDSEGLLPGGGRAAATNSWTFVDANKCVWKSINRHVNGQPVADTEVEFARQGGNAPAAGGN